MQTKAHGVFLLTVTASMLGSVFLPPPLPDKPDKPDKPPPMSAVSEVCKVYKVYQVLADFRI